MAYIPLQTVNKYVTSYIDFKICIYLQFQISDFEYRIKACYDIKLVKIS